MSALPYFSSLTQPETNISSLVTPLTSGANDMRLFMQTLDDVAQVGQKLIKLANVADKPSTIAGFVVPPKSSIWMDLSGVAQYRNSVTPVASDSGAYLTLLTGKTAGSHSGTASDPLSIPSSEFLDVGPGGFHWYPSSTMGRSGTSGQPLFSSRLTMNNVRFTNDSLTDSWFVSPGLGIHDFFANAVLTLDAATPKLIMFIKLYKVINYLVSTFTQLIPMPATMQVTKSIMSSGIFSGVLFH